jgi:hypothetical protein
MLKEKRMTAIMGTLTVVFFLCFSPYFILFMRHDLEDKELWLPIFAELMYLNSLINPLLYIGINSSVRHAVSHLLGLQRGSTNGKP